MNMPDCVVVFGATGMLGRNITEALRGRVRVCCFDSRSIHALRSFRTPPRTVIVNVAARRHNAATFDADQPEIVQTNVSITNAVYRFAMEQGIREVRSASSTAVYPAGCEVMDDENPVDMNSPVYAPYCWSKRWGEIAADLWHRSHGINTISFRLNTMYGPYDSMDEANAHVAAAFVMRALRCSDEFEIRGDPNLKRDFVYAPDAARAFVLSLGMEGVHAAVNCVTGERRSLLDLARCVLRSAGRDVSLRVVDAISPAIRRPPATSAAVYRMLPALPPFRGIEDGIVETMAWYRKALAA